MRSVHAFAKDGDGVGVGSEWDVLVVVEKVDYFFKLFILL